MKYKCNECGDECELVEESFDYAGTHCTHGQAGTHKTGEYLSRCCLGEFSERLGSDFEKVLNDNLDDLYGS